MKSGFSHWVIGGLLGLAGVGGLALLYANMVERRRVQLDRFTAPIVKQDLPPRGFTILHLSDSHFRADGRIQARKLTELQRLLARETYDVVALTGDLIHDTGGLPAAIALIQTLKPRYGIFFVPGNHDYAEYTPWGVLGHTWEESVAGGFRLIHVKQLAERLADFVRKVFRNELVRMPVCFNDVPAMLLKLENVGVRPLVNTAACVSIDGHDVWFAGVDDEMESYPDLAAAFEGVPKGVPLVLLAHNPDIWLQCGVDRADLVLSGHTHGGQVHLPFVGAIHTQGTHLRRKQAAGWFERGRSRMFVSRGLGESIPLRFGSRPQVALIRVIGAQSGS